MLKLTKLRKHQAEKIPNLSINGFNISAAYTHISPPRYFVYKIRPGDILNKTNANFIFFCLPDHSPNKVIRVSNIQISTDPVHIPGPETFSGDLEILHPISGNHFRLDVIIEKHILFGYPDMPCITTGGTKVGSWYVVFKVSLRGLGTLGIFFKIRYKEDNFNDLLFVFLHTMGLLKRGLLWKESKPFPEKGKPILTE